MNRLFQQYQEAVQPESPLVTPIYVQPTISPIVQQECPIQCPQGPPGRDVMQFIISEEKKKNYI